MQVQVLERSFASVYIPINPNFDLFSTDVEAMQNMKRRLQYITFKFYVFKIWFFREHS